MKACLEFRAQCGIHVGHARVNVQVRDARDAVLADATGDDAREVREVGVHVDREAVEADPAAKADAYRGDLVFYVVSLVRPFDPHTDAIFSGFSLHTEAIESVDGPCLKEGYERPDVPKMPSHIEHDIDDPLTRSVIGVLAATACCVDGKPRRFQQVLRLGACACGIEGRVLAEPDKLAGRASTDLCCALFHESDRAWVVDWSTAYGPFDSWDWFLVGDLGNGHALDFLGVVGLRSVLSIRHNCVCLR